MYYNVSHSLTPSLPRGKKLELFGELGDSGSHALKESADHKNKFERGNHDTFSVACVDLGALSKVRLTSSGKGVGADWFLDRVEVIEDDTTSRFVFPCGKWFNKTEGLTHEFVCTVDEVTRFAKDYRINVETADTPGAGTTVTLGDGN